MARDEPRARTGREILDWSRDLERGMVGAEVSQWNQYSQQPGEPGQDLGMWLGSWVRVNVNVDDVSVRVRVRVRTTWACA